MFKRIFLLPILFSTAVISSLFFSGCAHSPSDPVTGVPIDPLVRAEQEAEIRKADDALFLQDYMTSEKLYLNFEKQFPNSIFYQRAQFGRAKALEYQEKWADAAEIYRDAVQVNRSSQPEITAQALFRLSFCYENLGDEARVLATLNDALAMKDYLGPEQVAAEIPARLAASYSRMGRTKEAQSYFIKAEQGISQIRAGGGPRVTNIWLAQAYFQMGRLSTNQLTSENLQPSLDTLKMVQIFSLRSAEVGGEPWSKRAIQGLMENYRDHWNAIQEIPLHRAMEAGAAKREQTERKINFTGQLLTLISDLRQYRAPNESLAVQDLFAFLNSVEKQGKDYLLSVGERNALTPESERRMELRRQKVTVKAISGSAAKLPQKLPSKKVPSVEQPLNVAPANVAPVPTENKNETNQ